MLYLEKTFKNNLISDDVKNNNSNYAFDNILSYKGQVVRNVANRTTVKIKIGNSEYFIKQHNAQTYKATLKEVLKNFLAFKKPVLSALNEVQAIWQLEKLGIDTLTVSGYGFQKINLFKNKSFIITESLEPAMDLNDLNKIVKGLNSKQSYILKRNLIKKISKVTKSMHENYLVHQDFYLCHFLYKNDKLFLIDLHRMQKVNKLFFNYRKIKELADLFFSTKCVKEISKTDVFYFIKCYFDNNCLKDIFAKKTNKSNFHKIELRANRLYKKAVRKNII
tara:strand:+ start:10497 stop:11330 length:834 start_codon:yes stop_codon:yes gene_type:complete